MKLAKMHRTHSDFALELRESMTVLLNQKQQLRSDRKIRRRNENDTEV